MAITLIRNPQINSCRRDVCSQTFNQQFVQVVILLSVDIYQSIDFV